jgi:hypothetical protein
MKRVGRTLWGPLVKLNCDAAMINPTSATLWACAESEVGALSQMSNPQPSREKAQAAVRSRAVAMMTAAQRLAETDKHLSAKQALQLERDRLCVSRLLAEQDPKQLCRAPFAPAK